VPAGGVMRLGELVEHLDVPRRLLAERFELPARAFEVALQSEQATSQPAQRHRRRVAQLCVDVGARARRRAFAQEELDVAAVDREVVESGGERGLVVGARARVVAARLAGDAAVGEETRLA